MELKLKPSFQLFLSFEWKREIWVWHCFFSPASRILECRHFNWSAPCLDKHTRMLLTTIYRDKIYIIRNVIVVLIYNVSSMWLVLSSMIKTLILVCFCMYVLCIGIDKFLCLYSSTVRFIAALLFFSHVPWSISVLALSGLVDNNIDSNCNKTDESNLRWACHLILYALICSELYVVAE